jgi:hypothetical protein
MFNGKYNPRSLIKTPNIDLKTWLWIKLLELILGDVETKVVNIETPNLVLIHISSINPRIYVPITNMMINLR